MAPKTQPPSARIATAGRAAAYVRMSSSPQDHSIEHQCARLGEYADAHGIEIVKIYADAGKSGLRINGREGLQELMADVQAGRADFQMVLVYDVSRWGRFQDVDEGAHYEYTCRKAGIEVVYCAEPFANDGSALTSILKGLKRSMAAEYSRELSAKVFAAQCRYAAKGYKMGGLVGYGLRRVSYNKEGKLRRVLKAGERKVAATDRVRYSIGTQREIDVIRQIYQWYVSDKLGDTEIAAKLNELNVPTAWRGPWSAWLVKNILTNAKYAGRMIFNRGSSKMGSSRKINQPEDWISIDDALPAIVTAELYDAAMEERQRRMRRVPDADLLNILRALCRQHGRVTLAIINSTPGIPCNKYFSNRFGSLAAAYEAAGVPSAEPILRARTLQAVRQMRDATTSAIKLAIEQAGATHAPAHHKRLLKINSDLLLRIEVARSRHDRDGRVRWRIPIHAAPEADFVLCVQMDIANVGVMGYYLIPVADFTQGHIILRAECPEDRGQYRYPSLGAVFGLGGGS